MINKALKILMPIAATCLLTTSMITKAQAESNNERYLVTFNKGTMAKGKQQLAKQGAKVALSLDNYNTVAVRLNDKAATSLAKNPMVEFIERDQPVTLTSQKVPYSIPMIQANQLSDASSSNIKICVIDTGIQTSHEDFVGANISGTADPDAGQWNQPDQSHGTYMIGGIVAMNNSIGVVGGMPNGYVSIHSHKLPSGGRKWSSSVAYGIDQCVANNTNIISMSFLAGKTRTLTRALENAHAAGNLLIASAGNDGDTSSNHPALSELVMAVSAVDKNKKFAAYSNENEFNEIAAPGSAVLGTEMMGNGREANLTINGVSDYEAVATPTLNNGAVLGTVEGSVTATLVDCGIADTNCAGAVGNICLIESTDFNLTNQVLNCQNAGGLGVIAHDPTGYVQFEGHVEEGMTNIPVATISVDEAVIAQAQVGQSVSLDVTIGNYIRAFGTSLSSPKVASAAALAWSYHPTCTNDDIRNALTASAEDLGTPGRDHKFGYGLVQAVAAKQYLDANPCGVAPEGILLDARVYKSKGKWYLDLTWTGATGSNVDIHKDGAIEATEANDELYSVRLIDNGTFVYKVCEEATSECSNEVTVTF